jgi:beta-phosphoglucomutase-like phosphatase (HAD superfamily)
MTRTQAIVFDMDGVLIDSEELHAHAKRIAFAHAGIAVSDTDLRSYVGRSDAVMIDEIGARYGLTDGQRSTVLNEKKRIYEQEEQGIKIVPGSALSFGPCNLGNAAQSNCDSKPSWHSKPFRSRR